MKKRVSFSLLIGCIMTTVVIIIALVSLIATPYSPEAMETESKLAGISLQHIMGCDQFGRDIFSRVMVACRLTLEIACGTVLIGATIGTLIGAVTGYFGGMADEILMRVNDVIFAFPSILLALLIISLLGSGTKQITLALGIAFVPSYSRIVRGEFMRCREIEYVKSAKIAGAGHIRIMFVHILPNIFPVLLSSIMIGFNNAVLAEAGLSFLGIGVQPPQASLGRMLSEAQTYLFSNPTYVLGPGLILIIMILGFSLLAEEMKKSDRIIKN